MVGTVMSFGLSACAKTKWLPRVLTRVQPLRPSMRMSCRGLTAGRRALTR
jgi:hypothetical protein